MELVIDHLCRRHSPPVVRSGTLFSDPERWFRSPTVPQITHPHCEPGSRRSPAWLPRSDAPVDEQPSSDQCMGRLVMMGSVAKETSPIFPPASGPRETWRRGRGCTLPLGHGELQSPRDVSLSLDYSCCRSLSTRIFTRPMRTLAFTSGRDGFPSMRIP